ncbi:MAG: immune inhibitor A [Deltaproteobacteria bacterium]|nr:immune inhibitor A [Deltaproteobacteria bacterium]
MFRVLRTLTLAVTIFLSLEVSSKPYDQVHYGCLADFDEYKELKTDLIKYRESSLGSFERSSRINSRFPIHTSRFLPGAEEVTYPLTRVDRILVVLVEFTGENEGEGPLHNKIPEPQFPNTHTFWKKDFDTQHYEDMLFSRDPKKKSMANFYLEQSSGRYTVEGKVVGWYKLPNAEKFYGEDDPNNEVYGKDRKNGPVWRVVKDAIESLEVQGVDVSYFDQEDRYDFDKDGNFREPDGYIDHAMIVHAGMGQEAGGGEEGSNAMWSHRSVANFIMNGGPSQVGPQYYKKMGGIRVPGLQDKWVLDYTLMPENGGVGIFSHEYGHDLGLPDLYDTRPVKNSQSSVAFWSVMSSGSWTADENNILGTQPTHMSAWGKEKLGWLDLEEIHLDHVATPRQIVLDRASFQGKNKQALKINLPKHEKVVKVAEPQSGAYLFFGGSGDLLNSFMIKRFDLRNVSQATLYFKTLYDIEENYDYAYVEVKKAASGFQTISGNITTDLNPNSLNRGFGITGKSDGWVVASFDLTPFVGNIIELRFFYETDANMNKKGIVVDDISIPEIGFYDNAEADQSWLSNGFKRLHYGENVEHHDHYYLAEWRAYHGYDSALGNVYKGMPLGENLPSIEFYKYVPGLVLWYRNLKYQEGDNNVGVHPGEGFLLVVDANSEPRLAQEKTPWGTTIQVFDAAFGLKTIAPFFITGLDKNLHKIETFANPLFDDRNTYYSELDPDNSVHVPNMGVELKVLETSQDDSSVVLSLRKRI